jgi:hypothetical protein
VSTCVEAVGASDPSLRMQNPSTRRTLAAVA